MEHIYLSKNEIEQALRTHAITNKEAKKLQKKVDYQVKIYKVLHK